jgi:hypothetical protein
MPDVLKSLCTVSNDLGLNNLLVLEKKIRRNRIFLVVLLTKTNSQII